MDKTTDQKDTAKLAIFVKDVGREFKKKELFSLQSIKSTTTGADIFTEVLIMLLKLSE